MISVTRRTSIGVVVIAGVLAGCSSTAETTTSTAPTTVTTAATSATLVPAPPVSQVVIAPLPPDDIAAYVFGVWLDDDLPRLKEITSDRAYQKLAGRPPQDGDDWVFDSCQSVLGITYCAWVGSTDVLAMKVDDRSASKGYVSLIDAAFRTNR